MIDRAERLERFLQSAGWADATRQPLAGDASKRRYIRLSRGSDRAMLMDAPPEAGEDTRPFVALARWIASANLSAPQIIASDAEFGFLLLEDLGDDLLAVHLNRHPERETDLYVAATETLTAWQGHPPPDLPSYLPQMADLTTTVFDWYAPAHMDRKADLAAAMQAAMDATLTGPPVVVHRDYHAENLLWLPDRIGVRRIGLLDFQDAMLGPAEYDLASLIHDVRRTVGPAARAAAKDAFLAATDDDPAMVEARIAVCSAQRALRIIGRVFTRLSLQEGRTSYLRFVPPTWAILQADLHHPALSGVRAILDGILPEPDAAWQADMVARAGSRAGHPDAGPPAGAT